MATAKKAETGTTKKTAINLAENPATEKNTPVAKQTPETKDVKATEKKTTKASADSLKEIKVKIPKTTVKTSIPYQPDYQPLEERVEEVVETITIVPETGLLVRYSDAELHEFKDLIHKKLLDAKRELSYLQGLITRKDHLGGEAESRYMTMEDGTVSMEREQLSQMASRQISYIDHLEKALIRIENKTYGVCRVTGKLIEKARLKAVPHATLSLEAKMGMKK